MSSLYQRATLHATPSGVLPLSEPAGACYAPHGKGGGLMPVNFFDQAARYVIKLDPAGFFAWLLGGLVVLVFREWLDTRTLPFPGERDRTCDTVARLDDPANPDDPLALV